MRLTASVVHPTAPDAPPPDGPPADRVWSGEWRSALQVPRLVLRAPELLTAPRGDGAPTMVIPGWRAPEASMAPLRAYLRWLGHDARYWGFGTNQGLPERDSRRLAAVVARLADAAGRGVALVGWSLGGTVARETARIAPDAVTRVVTYGTPAVGGPRHTVGARTLGDQETTRIADLVDRLDAETPIPVPITAIFTRRDSVVNWTACIDRRSPDVRHVEVTSTHLSLGVDPDVWSTVAQALSAAPGRS